MITIMVRKCQCGHENCQTYWILPLWRYTPGDGCSKEEAEKIALAMVLAYPEKYQLSTGGEMIPQLIEGANMIVGESQVEYEGLPVRRTMLEWNAENGKEFSSPAFISEWKPNAAELESLNNGGSIFLSILHMNQHPPVLLTVEPPPIKAVND